MKALAYVLPLVGRLRGPLLLTLGLSLVTLAAGVALLGISGWFLTAAAITTAGVAFNLFAPSAGVRGLSFVRILSRYGEKVTGHDATLRLLSSLRRSTFAGLFRLVPVSRLFGRGDLVSRLVADLDALDSIFLVGLGPLATAVMAGTGMTVLLAFTLPAAAAVYAVGFAVATVGVPVLLVVASRRAGAEIVASSAALRSAILDGIEGHQDLVLFDAVGRARESAERCAGRLSAAKARLGRMTAWASAAVQALSGMVLVATLACGLSAVNGRAIDGPLMVGLVLAVVASFEASAVVVRSARGIAAAAAADRLSALAGMPSSIVEPADPKALPPGGTVGFEDVRFSYRDGAAVLDGVSFHVAEGECVAIKGPSGVGKSTIAQLLVRLIDPAAGRVMINGRDVREVGSAALRQRVALMTQDAPVFNATVRNNLLIGRPDAADEALWVVLDLVGMKDVVSHLAAGLDTVLGEGGRTLSAGQARRICLARTLLSPASIIVLDEPTAGLDVDAERAFLEDVPSAVAGRTMIVITHAELPPAFGRVLELRAGCIAANDA
mgnify:CR=1 FL=1